MDRQDKHPGWRKGQNPSNGRKPSKVQHVNLKQKSQGRSPSDDKLLEDRPSMFRFRSHGEDTNRRNQGNTKTPRSAIPGSSSPNVNSFWNRLGHIVSNCRNKDKSTKAFLDLNSEEDKKNWLATWSSAASGANGPLSVLIDALLFLPGQDAIVPPALDVVRVLTRFIESDDKIKNEYLDKVANVIRDRLRGQIVTTNIPDLIREIKSLQAKYRKVVGILTMNSEDISMIQRLLKRTSDINAYVDEIVEFSNKNTMSNMSYSQVEDNMIEPWKGWAAPTVGWLTSAKWHHARQLSSAYESVEDYSETLKQTWSLLTFYWGSGALFPRCHHGSGAEGDMACGEPLLSHVKSNSHSFRCTKRNYGVPCTQPASWRCYKKDHSAVCKSCLNRCQEGLMGAPGAGASTDIYDAMVERETLRAEGVVYVLRQLQSRKPPTKAPNWRTTYRLQSSVLVGIVRLNYSGEGLIRASVIQWGEVVPITIGKDSFREEPRHRAQGRIAVRLLGPGDCSSLSVEADSALDIGMHLAVIDLRVFVPEVVSVLSTLSGASFTNHLTKIPFINSLIGCKDSENERSTAVDLDAPSEASIEPVESSTWTVLGSIRHAIQHSDIECIQVLDNGKKNDLVDKIFALPQVKSLYGTQLEAFRLGLTSALHCTQGPPGTGKSYLGVCLARTLDIIRNVAISSGFPVGPVLVLSYKNHALDEFLVDLTKGMNPRLNKGELIRCGKPDNESLEMYMEQRSWTEKDANQMLADSIRVIRQSRRIEKNLNECSSQLLIGNIQWLAFTPPDPSLHRHVVHTKGVAFQNAFTSSIVSKLSEAIRLMHELMCTPDKLMRIIEGIHAFESSNAYKMLRSVVDNADSSLDLSNMIRKFSPLIWEGAVHWHPQDRIQEFMSDWGLDWPSVDRVVNLEFFSLMYIWMKGRIPPPRCEAEEGTKRCTEYSALPSPYCRLLHNCCSALQRGCTHQRAFAQVPFCDQHRCSQPSEKPCGYERILNSAYCATHSCSVCVSLGSKVVGRAQPNACKQHQCAGFHAANDVKKGDWPCANVRIIPHKYCACHLCLGCQATETVFDLPKTNESDYCIVHKCLFEGCKDMKLDVKGTREFHFKSSYCQSHSCSACIRNRAALISSVDPKCPTSEFCSNHRCQHPLYDCEDQRITASRYCTRHSCRICAQQGRSCEDPVIEEGLQRNVCARHKLCTKLLKKGNMCSELAVEPFFTFCRDHTTSFQGNDVSKSENKGVTNQFETEHSRHFCSGITKKGNACHTPNPTGVRWYCPDHRNQEQQLSRNDRNFEVTKQSESVNNLYCWGRTKKGKPCRTLNPTGGKWYCTDHRNQNVPSSVDMVIDVHEMSSPGQEEESQYLQEGCNKNDIGSTDNRQMQEAVVVASKWIAGDDDDDEEGCAEFKDCSDADFALLQDGLVHTQVSLDDVPIGTGNDIAVCVTAKSRELEVGIDAERAPLGDSAQDTDGDIAADDAVGNVVDHERLDPDEMDVIPEELFFEAEENENLRRLREVDEVPGGEGDVDTKSDDEFDETQHCVYNTTGKEPLSNELTFEDLSSALSVWSWDMSADVRLAVAAQFLNTMREVIRLLRVRSERHISELRKRRAEASANTFKAARIIGATVVGASRRLEAIRAAEPFAVIVEEACEVMEPTLMSVLAVKSLRKLELIGDHRQLPAFVQNEWYSLKITHPSISISLFERLVESSAKLKSSRLPARPIGGVTSLVTVLDEQRRMRPVISDLTRMEYADLVEIKDHSNTLQKCIGDSVDSTEKQSLDKIRPCWPALGRSVPGLTSCVYFWDIEGNKEGRPEAGLSACNRVEAEAAVALTKWLLACGCPKSSITIITPYKGQSTVILRLLRECRIIDRQSRSLLTVSTVDRYQGDENDIVILSLVRTQPGNRFVELSNRFIVATSRARIGFFIIGSVNGVCKEGGPRLPPKHWKRFLETLKKGLYMSEDLGTTPVDPEQGSYEGERVGPSLPICCPFHPSSTQMSIRHPSHFPVAEQEHWNTFCSLPCGSKVVGCGHPCGKLCHSLTCSPHTIQSECNVQIERRCADHQLVPLYCKTLVFDKIHSTIELALSAHECEIIMKYTRPECGHTKHLTCHKYKQVTSGLAALGHCKQKVPPFILSCGHELKDITCFKRQEFETKPPVCLEQVHFHRQCGCTVQMYCKDVAAERLNPPPCQTPVNCPRPICGHAVSVRCSTATELRRIQAEYDGKAVTLANKSDDSKTVLVKYDDDYQLSTDRRHSLPECQVLVSYYRSCGHIIENIPCNLALQYWSIEKSSPDNSSLPPCEVLVKSVNPLCKHRIRIPCKAAAQLSSWLPWHDTTCPLIERDEEISTHESLLYSSKPAPHPSASMRKRLDRLCHYNSVTITRLCDENHTVSISCKDLLSVMTGSHPLVKCTSLVERSLPCHHIENVECWDRDNLTPPVCQKVVKDIFTYPCGVHSVSGLPCNRYQELVAAANPLCGVHVHVQRYRCSHRALVPCYLKHLAEKPLPGTYLEPSFGVGEQLNRPEVVYGVEYCDSPTELPNCEMLIDYVRGCGHVRKAVPCHLAFQWARGSEIPPPCSEIIDHVKSPLCGHDVSYPCGERDKLLNWRPWGEEGIPGEDSNDEQGLDDDSKVTRTRFITHTQYFQAPSAVPSDILSGFLSCNNGCVSYERNCGHIIKCPCVQLFYGDIPPCQEVVSCDCSNVTSPHSITMPCHEYTDIVPVGKAAYCSVTVNKLCTVCKVNSSLAECSAHTVNCNNVVRVALQCGHPVTWKCGRQQDPRLQSSAATNCRSCLLKIWNTQRNEIKNSPVIQIGRLNDTAFDSMLTLWRRYISDTLERNTRRFHISRVLNATPEAVVFHYQAFYNLFEEYYGMVTKERFSLPPNPPPKPDSLKTVDDLPSCYDVCCQVLPNGKNYESENFNVGPIKESFCSSKPTKYGHGIQLTCLSDTAIKVFKPDERGVVTLCVGVAYKFQVLSGVAPFNTMLVPGQINNHNNHPKGRNQKDKRNKPNANKYDIAIQTANASQRKHMNKGFDSADCMDVIEGKVMPTCDRIYWHPGSVLPLAIYEVQYEYFCNLCREYFDNSKGLQCQQSHFICWECFDQYLESSIQVDTIARAVDLEGNLRCPDTSCDSKYSMKHISEAKGSEAIMNKFMNLKVELISRTSAQAARDEERRNAAKEMERIMKIQDLDERAAHRLKMNVIENILNLRCPRCRAAFFDFDGCCLADCGGDAHSHVRNCPHKPSGTDSYFGTKQQFEEHHRMRRKQLVQQEISKEPLAVQTIAKQLLRSDLKDLGIAIE